MSHKDIWFKHHERDMSERMEAGLDWEAASELAAETADFEAVEEAANRADWLSDCAKEGGLDKQC